jgi:hypothetical protein
VHGKLEEGKRLEEDGRRGSHMFIMSNEGETVKVRLS